MKYALISDVHANLPALDAVLADIERTGAIATYHLGDLVGYSSQPNEVVARIRDEGIAGVAGNYDSTVATGYKHCGCRSESPRQEELAHVSYEWTRANTSAATKRFLAGLPFRVDIRPLGGHLAGPAVTLLHGNNVLNTVYTFEDRPDATLEKMASAVGARGGDVVAFGHTHKPWHREVGGVHFVNTGSVGRPKDGDWRAGYVLLDVDANGVRVEIVRVPYDIDRAIAGIREAALPEDFVEFLKSGGKPAAVGTPSS
ncbi:MAG TPA: metallophosphoesterase family protein [Gemmatimonadaceae bacterium]